MCTFSLHTITYSQEKVSFQADKRTVKWSYKGFVLPKKICHVLVTLQFVYRIMKYVLLLVFYLLLYLYLWPMYVSFQGISLLRMRGIGLYCEPSSMFSFAIKYVVNFKIIVAHIKKRNS